MLVVLLAIIDSKNKLKRCWAELCRLASVAGRGWVTKNRFDPYFPKIRDIPAAQIEAMIEADNILNDLRRNRWRFYINAKLFTH